MKKTEELANEDASKWQYKAGVGPQSVSGDDNNGPLLPLQSLCNLKHKACGANASKISGVTARDLRYLQPPHSDLSSQNHPIAPPMLTRDYLQMASLNRAGIVFALWLNSPSKWSVFILTKVKCVEAFIKLYVWPGRAAFGGCGVAITNGLQPQSPPCSLGP